MRCIICKTRVKIILAPMMVLVFTLFFGFNKPTQQIRIKLATLAPKGSSWEMIIKEMGQQWKRDTDGFVTLTVYPGGIVGDEASIIRKMRIGQFHAATITTVGLSQIDSSIMALSHIPLLYKNYDELDYVREKFRGKIEERMEGQGFKVLNWGDVGWVHFFTQKPMTHPDQLKKMKLFFWSNETSGPSLEIWKKMGFNLVPLAATDIMIGLQTGLINAVDTTPLAALSNQWFGIANHMADMKWAPLLGATIVSMDTWNRIPSDYQKVMLRAAGDAEKKLKEDTRSLNVKAIELMKENGLVVHEVSDEDFKVWKENVNNAYPFIRKNIIPQRYFDEVLYLVQEYRDQHLPDSSAIPNDAMKP